MKSIIESLGWLAPFLLPCGVLSAANLSLETVWLRGAHQWEVNSVRFSPDGRFAASAADSGSVNVYRLADGMLLQSLASQRGDQRALAFSPDGARLLVGSQSKDKHSSLRESATIFSIGPGEILRILNRIKNAHAVDWNNTGSQILVAGEGISVREVRANSTGLNTEEIALLNVTNAFTRTAVFSPDGTLIAAGNDEGTLAIWGGTNALVSVRAHSGIIRTVIFSWDGNLIASAGDDGLIQLWNAWTLEKVGTLSGHTDAIRAIAFSPDSKTLVSGGWDQVLYLWNVVTQRIIASAPEPSWIRALDVSPDGKLILLGNKAGEVKLYQLPELQPLEELTAHNSPVTSVIFSSDGFTFVSGDAKGTIIFWDAFSGKIRARIPEAHIENPVPPVPVEFSGPTIRLLAHRRGTTEIVSAGDDRIRIWDAFTGRPLRTIRESEGIRRAAISADGSLVAAVVDEKLRVWNLDSGATAAASSDSFLSGFFYPDGTLYDIALRGNTNLVLAFAVRDFEKNTFTNRIAVLALPSFELLTDSFAVMPYIDGLPHLTLDGNHWHARLSPGISEFRSTSDGRPAWRITGTVLGPVSSAGAGQFVVFNSPTLEVWDAASRSPIGTKDNGNGPLFAVSPKSESLFAVSPKSELVGGWFGDAVGMMRFGLRMQLEVRPDSAGTLRLTWPATLTNHLRLEVSTDLFNWMSSDLPPDTAQTDVTASRPMEFFRLRSR